MRASIIYSTVVLGSFASALPASKRSNDGFSFPLPNGFPNPNPSQIIDIENEAGGTLPNGPPPPTLSPDGVTNLQLVATNELFEVAFFTELVNNVTNEVPGYKIGFGRGYVLDTLQAIVAQEQLHALQANEALKHFNQEPIQPCKYTFPVSDFWSAIALAATFTDVVLGTLQDVNQIFAQNGDFPLVRAVSSVLGNEAEQEGFFRFMQKKRPSALPFLTTSTRDFAFTAIQDFTIPGSCPNINIVKLKTFKPLKTETKNIEPKTQNIKFSFAKADAGTDDFGSLSLVWINQQNDPIIKSLDNVKVDGDTVMFEAQFPYNDFIMNGLTLAAVTKGNGPFANPYEVATATIFGPGLIEIN